MLRPLRVPLGLLGFLLPFSVFSAGAPPGDLDPTFGDGGFVVLPELSSWANSPGSGITIQPDGKIVVAGRAQVGPEPSDVAFGITLLLPDGSIDETFGLNGLSAVDFGISQDGASSVAVQGDGKIVVGGTVDSEDPYDFGFARLMTDGTLDGGFGLNGRVSFDFPSSFNDVLNDLVIQDDGRIVAVGTADQTDDNVAVLRLMPDGSLDHTFADQGWLTMDIDFNDFAHDVEVQPDGKILVSGGSTGIEGVVLIRLLPDGALDPGFGGDGIVTAGDGEEDSPGALGMELQGDGKIVVAGTAFSVAHGGENFLIMRYTPEGRPDRSFGRGGRTWTNFGPNHGAGSSDRANDLAIQTDGRIVVVGSAEAWFALARYESDGTLDRAFSGDGKVVTRFPDSSRADQVRIQPDGRIVASGTIDGNTGPLVVARYLAE
jgi:uncharacterized delta-60 repeat protein